jgi:hypothetical protein
LCNEQEQVEPVVQQKEAIADILEQGYDGGWVDKLLTIATH